MNTRIYRGEKLLGEYDLEEGEYLIGSADTAHLRFEDPSVAPEHARLKIGAGGAEVEDLGSGRGTLLGELAVAGVIPVPEGALIHVGDLALQVWSGAPPESAEPQAEPEGRYVIGDVVAQGAMGLIRRAREVTTGREVAMKQMHDRLAAGDPALAARFAQEARITAHLEHPNVVPVHDVSTGAGADRFYTMKMVRGVSLEEVFEELKRQPEKAAEKYALDPLLTIFQKICDALAFAHSKGIIHRDLKPANIMVGEFGEVLVMDWGVAKVLAEKEAAVAASVGAGITDAHDSVSTMAGTIMGTPYYMAPEQANGELENLDERSDIYALGAILYELLTLQTSVLGRATSEVLQAVRTGAIITPVERVGGKLLAHLPGGRIPVSLAAVAMKALAFAPPQRYRQVRDLQADIRAYQAGHATGAEEAGAWRQFTLLINRHKGIAAAIAASVLLLAVLSVVYTLSVVRERDRTAQALAQVSVEKNRVTEALAQVEPERRRANAERDRATAALAQVNIEKTRVTEALAQVEPERKRANAERDRAVAALAAVEAEKQRADVEKNRATEALAQVEPERRRANAERDRAVDALNRLRSVAPSFVQLAASQAKLQQFGEGQAAIDAALSLDPDLKSAYWRRAWLLAGEQKLPEAIEAMREAARRDPANLEAAAVGTAILRLQSVPAVKDEVLTPVIRALLAVDAGGEAAPFVRQLKETDTRYDAVNAKLRQWLGDFRRQDRPGGVKANLLADGGISVEIARVGLGDITPLRGLPIDELNIRDADLESIEPLRGMQLRNLFLRGCARLKDLSPLQGIPLQKLALDAGSVTTFSVFKDLPLVELLLTDAVHFEDLRVLAGKQLRRLDLESSSATDFTPLQGLPLERLQLKSCRLSDLSIVRDMPLIALALVSTPVSDLKPLAATSIETLTLFDVPVKDVRPLLQMKKLADLRTDLPMETILPLRGHPGIRSITYGAQFPKPAAEFWAAYDRTQHGRR